MPTTITLRFRSSDGHHVHYDAVIDRQLVERAVVVQCATNRVAFSHVSPLSADTRRQLIKMLLASERKDRRLVHHRYMGAGDLTDAAIGRDVLRTSVARSRAMVLANRDVLQATTTLEIL